MYQIPKVTEFDITKFGGFLNPNKFFKYVKVLLVSVLIIVNLILFVPFALLEYSDGVRSGLLNKLSSKGLICKSYEGYMMIGDGNVINPEIFRFTVKDQSVVKQLSSSLGKVVSLEYKQYLVVSPCWGDTSYEVVGIKQWNQNQ